MTMEQDYMKKLQERVDRSKEELERLESAAGEAKAEVKQKLSKETEGLRQKIEAAEGKLESLKEGSSEKWDVLKGEAEEAFNSLKDAFEKVKSRMSSKG